MVYKERAQGKKKKDGAATATFFFFFISHTKTVTVNSCSEHYRELCRLYDFIYHDTVEG